MNPECPMHSSSGWPMYPSSGWPMYSSSGWPIHPSFSGWPIYPSFSGQSFIPLTNNESHCSCHGPLINTGFPPGYNQLNMEPMNIHTTPMYNDGKIKDQDKNKLIKRFNKVCASQNQTIHECMFFFLSILRYVFLELPTSDASDEYAYKCKFIHFNSDIQRVEKKIKKSLNVPLTELGWEFFIKPDINKPCKYGSLCLARLIGGSCSFYHSKSELEEFTRKRETMILSDLVFIYKTKMLPCKHSFPRLCKRAFEGTCRFNHCEKSIQQMLILCGDDHKFGTPFPTSGNNPAVIRILEAVHLNYIQAS